jgi:plastocyanin
MKRSALLTIGIACLIAVSFIPVTAGGWATVRYDKEPGNIVAGETHTFALSVWAHDRAEIDVEQLVLVATHTASGDEITQTAQHSGTTGHYTVEITFTSDGNWKLTALIPPYPEFALPTLTILSSPMDRTDLSGALNIELVAGSCSGELASATPVELMALGTREQGLWGQIDARLADLTAGPSALVLRGDNDSALACADLEDAIGATRIVVPMTPLDEGRDAGLVVLDANGESTALTFYPLSIAAPSRVVQVDIVGTGENWLFEPANVEVARGTMVVWRNQTAVAHTIAGSSLDFQDSAIIEPGGSFVQVFNEPGAYEYICGPHTWMTGTVRVND